MKSFLDRLTSCAKQIVPGKRRTREVCTCSLETLPSSIFMIPVLGLLVMLAGCAGLIGHPLTEPCCIIDTSKGECTKAKGDCTKVFAEFQEGGLKLGLLADSHFQTTKSLNFVPGVKGRSESDIIHSALRAPGHDYLSPLVMAYFIDRLKEKNVNAILYLGDGPNNGCSDEIDRVFEVLEKGRKDGGPPIFYIIGNHDYLGNGNTDRWNQRLRLCDDRPLGLARFKVEKMGEFKSLTLERNDQMVKLLKESSYNLPLNKLEVIEKIATFNKGNKDYDGWTYYDSDDKGNLRDKCVKQGFSEQHKKEECFLAGWASLNSNRLLFMDTSNYGQSQIRPKLMERIYQFFGRKVLETEYYGDWGYITKKQEEWLKDNSLHGSEHKPLIVVSHYPLKGLNLTRDEDEDLFNKGVCTLISSATEADPAPSQVVWVSAHTHQSPTYYKRKCEGKNITVHMINIGSTIDWAEPFGPHAAVLNISDKGQIAMEFIALPYTHEECPTVPETRCEMCKRCETCKKIIDKVCELASDPGYTRAGDKEDAFALLGFGTGYKKRTLEEKYGFALGLGVQNYQRNEDVFPPLNLIRFVQAVKSDFDLFADPDDTAEKEVGACLAGFASYLEDVKPNSAEYHALCKGDSTHQVLKNLRDR